MPHEQPISSQAFLAEMLRSGPVTAAEFHALPHDVQWAIEVEWIRAWLAGTSPSEVIRSTSREETLASARLRALDRSAMMGYGKSLLRRNRHDGHPGGATSGPDG